MYMNHAVLMVDDDEIDQIIAKVTLNEYDDNMTLCHAYDGEEALNILSQLDHEPDLILLDLHMPGMDGLDFLDKYAKTTDKPTPVIILTASHQYADKERALAYPFVKQHIVKPINTSDYASLFQIL